MMDIENPSWAPLWNGVHPSEFVFQKSRAIASDFCGIKRHMLSRAVASVFFEEHRPQKLPIYGLYAVVARDSCLPCNNAIAAQQVALQHVALLVASRVNVPLQAHKGEPPRAPMIDSISSTVFFLVITSHKNIGNHFQIVENHGQRPKITAEYGRKARSLRPPSYQISIFNQGKSVGVFSALQSVSRAGFGIMGGHLPPA